MRTLLSCSLPLVLLLWIPPAPARAEADEQPLTRLSWRVSRNWRKANNPLDEPVGPVVSPSLFDVPGALGPLTRHLGGPLPWNGRGFLHSLLEHGFSVAPRGQKVVAWLMALLEEEKEGGALPGPALPEHRWGTGMPGWGTGGGMGRGSMAGGSGGMPGGGGGGGGGGGIAGSHGGGGSGAGSLVGGSRGDTGGATSGAPGSADPNTVTGGPSSAGPTTTSGTWTAISSLGSSSSSQGSQSSSSSSPSNGTSSPGGSTPSGGTTSSGGSTSSGGITSTGGGSSHPGVAPSAPEIDPGGAVGALALLAGGVLLLTDRLRRKG